METDDLDIPLGIAQPTPFTDVLWDRVWRAAEPFVRNLRLQVFGKSAPPFRSMRVAAAWLESKEVSGEEPPETRADLRRVLEESAGPITRAGRATKLRVDMTPSAVLLAYVRPGEDTVRRCALRPAYWCLADAVQELARRTLVHPASITGWVLVGGPPPRVASVTMMSEAVMGSLSDGTALPPCREIRLVLRAPVTDATMRALLRRTKVYWASSFFDPPPAGAQRRRGKKVTELDRHLDEIVDRLPLDDFTWAERCREWKRTPPRGISKEAWESSKDSQATATTLRIRWRRLQPKLGGGPPQEG